MGARRSKKRRTVVGLPRGNRRPRSASTLLLSFALLAALSSVGAQGVHGRGPGSRGVSLSPGKVSASTASRAGSTSKSSATVASVSHRPLLMPPPPLPRVRPKRVAAALDQDACSPSALPALVAAPPDVGGASLLVDRIDEGATATFLAFASDSSRTRGQPVSDC